MCGSFAGIITHPLCPSDISPKYDNENLGCGVEDWCVRFGGEQVTMVTDENGLFDAPRHGRDLTQIEMINRRVGLPLSRGERVWGRFLFCGDEKLGCMVERELLRR